MRNAKAASRITAVVRPALVPSRILRPHRLKQNGVPMKIQKLLLTACEASDVHNLGDFDTHALKRWPMSNGRDNQFSVVLETYEAAIKKVINAWR